MKIRKVRQDKTRIDMNFSIATSTSVFSQLAQYFGQIVLQNESLYVRIIITVAFTPLSCNRFGAYLIKNIKIQNT